MRCSKVVNYPHYDQVGSLRAISDSSGTVIKKIDYDSFGNVISDSNPAFTVPFGFAGGLYDYDTGLTRFGFRDYDPSIGRWTAKDPIDFAGGDVNLFQYVQADPVNFVDPLGLDPQIPPEEGGGYWTVNPVTKCHFNPKRDPYENLTEGFIIGSALLGLVSPNPWMGKIAIHKHAGGPHQYRHLQIMIRTGRHTTRHIRFP